MAAMTSQNDRLTLELKNTQAKLEAKEAELAVKEEKLAKTEERLAKAKAPKTFEKTLDNGNIQIRKVSNNGTVMTKETTADGKLLEYKVATADGLIRKTKFNPVTGKPVKTYTNTTGDKVIDYNLDGKSVSEKLVNVKKSDKPTVINKQVIDGKTPKVVETYSNGDVKTTSYHANGQKSNIEVVNSDGARISSKQFVYDNHGQSVANGESFFDEKGNVIKHISYNAQGKTTTHKLYFNDGKSVRVTAKEFETPSGIKLTSRYIKDENGIYSNNYETLIKYPKSSKIKSSKITYTNDFCPEKEVLTMRDGSKIVVIVDNTYGAYEFELIPKGQKSGTIMQCYGDNKEAFNKLYDEIVNEGFITGIGSSFIPCIGGKYSTPN